MIDFKIVKYRNLKTTSSFIDGIKNMYNTINQYHTDNFGNYKTYFKMNNMSNYTLTKDNTTQVESFNSILRGFVPALVRKTKCVTHSISNLYKRLHLFLFFYNKKVKNYFLFRNICNIFAL